WRTMCWPPMNLLLMRRSPLLLQQFAIAHHHHERCGCVRSRRAFEVEGIVRLWHAKLGNGPGHRQSDVCTLLLDVILTTGDVQFRRTRNLNHIAFHLQGHVLNYIPDLVLIFRSTGRKDQFPFAETQLLDLIRSLVLYQIMCLLSGSGRNVLCDLVSPVCWRGGSGFCSQKCVVCPTLV